MPHELPRESIRCMECGQDFVAIRGVIPHCMPCERATPTSLDERMRMRHPGMTWDRLMAARSAPVRFDTEGRISMPARCRDAQPLPEVTTWCARPDRPLVLTGPVGRGKTWQACAALMVLTSRRRDGMSYLRTCDQIARSDTSEMARLAGALAVCVDDLGARLSPHAIATSLEVIDRRIGDMCPLIVTTNLGSRDLLTIEPRIESRLAAGLWLRLDGPDRRAGA